MAKSDPKPDVELRPDGCINGVYHHVSQQHLKGYFAEFDYRYNEREALGVGDAERMARSAVGIVGKRLTYRQPRFTEIPF